MLDSNPDYEVTPEPSADEREALDRALAELLAEEQHPAYASAWRRQAVRENLGDGSFAE